MDKNGEVEIASKKGLFRLKGVGRLIWNMLDGKHRIDEIVDNLLFELSLEETVREAMLNELVVVLNMLRERNVIIVNWDPLYKLQITQELKLT